jgi:hypothetical protein
VVVAVLLALCHCLLWLLLGWYGDSKGVNQFNSLNGVPADQCS